MLGKKAKFTSLPNEVFLIALEKATFENLWEIRNDTTRTEFINTIVLVIGRTGASYVIDNYKLGAGFSQRDAINSPH